MLAEMRGYLPSELEGMYPAGLDILRTCSTRRVQSVLGPLGLDVGVRGWGGRGAAPLSYILRMLKNAFRPQQGGEISLNIKVQFYFSMQQGSEMRERASFEADAIIRVLSGAVQANLPWFQQVNFIKAPSYCFHVF